MKKFVFGILVILFAGILSGCQTKTQIVIVTVTPEPTKIPSPTLAPTLVPTLAPVPTPVGQIFRDDFNQALQPGWMWLNENSMNWDITEQGWLRIKSEDESLINGYQNNLLMRNVPAEGNFKIDALVSANTTSNFQQASIYIFEDEGNYFSINRGYCEPCRPKGNGIYSDYKYMNKTQNFNNPRSIKTGKVYLRITVNRDKKEIIAYYAIEPDQWTQFRKIPLVIGINQVGLGASNSDPYNNADNLIALFDYFKISTLD